MKRGAAQVIPRLTPSQASHAHNHHHRPPRSMSENRAERDRRAERELQRQLLDGVDREQSRSHPIESEARLDSKGAPQRERQADQLQRQEYPGDQRASGPRLAPVERTDQRIGGGEAAPHREGGLDQRIDQRRPAAETHACDRVIRRLLLVGERDLALESRRHAVAMRGHRSRLPAAEPQANGRLRSQRRQEAPHQPIHGV